MNISYSSASTGLRDECPGPTGTKYLKMSGPCVETTCVFFVGWLVVFNVPSTARSFRDGTPIYCPLRRT